MLSAWRLTKTKLLASAWDGQGARKSGGRWNSVGIAVVYASGTLSLALVEVLVHLPSGILPAYSAVRVDFDESMLTAVERTALPAIWRACETQNVRINRVGIEETVRFETLAVHAAAEPDPRTGAVTAAIQMSTTFQRAADGTFPSGFAYIRDANPNRRALEAAVATLEGRASAVAVASGMAATMAVFQTLAPGDHVVAPLDAYFGTPKLLREHFVPWGLEVAFADMTDVAAVRAAIRPKTRLIWTETPSNPTIAVTDL